VNKNVFIIISILLILPACGFSQTENLQPKRFSGGGYIGSLKMERLPFNQQGHQLLEGSRTLCYGFNFNARVWKALIGLNLGIYKPTKELSVVISELPDYTFKKVGLEMFYNTELLASYPVIDKKDLQILPSIGYGGTFGTLNVAMVNNTTGTNCDFEETYNEGSSYLLTGLGAYKSMGPAYFGLSGKKIFDDNHSSIISANIGMHSWSRRTYGDSFIFIIIERQWGRIDIYNAIGLGLKVRPYIKPDYHRKASDI
jgi:hypothetical protein